ncbi:MAG: thiamine pyrophosphate-dependent enzyme, partial [Promethearchaeota archaeon]
KDIMKYAFEFSERFNTVAIVRTTTRLNHARGDLVLGARVELEPRNHDFDGDSARWTFLPSNARVQRVKLLQRFEKLKDFSNEFPFTSLNIVDGAKVGLITSGIPCSYSLDAILNLNLQNKISVLKLGMVFPPPEALIEKLFNNVERVLIVEELDPFLEDFTKKLAHDLGSNIEIQGKKYFPRNGELNLTKTIEGIASFLGIDNPFVNLKIKKDQFHAASPRPPVLCPGCSHRSTFYALKLVERKTKKKFVYSGDIGCYTLGFYKPIEAIDTCICMGASIGLANGISKLHDGPVFAIIGDSTFFHTGVPALINAVYNGNNLIVMIMDNSVTAMTGFQPHPGTGILITGEKGVKIPLEQIVLGTGVRKDNLWVVDANDLHQLVDAITSAINKNDGPKVIISRRECSLFSRRTKKGQKIVPVYIDKDICNNCMICVKDYGCPAITLSDNHEVMINELQCTGCNVCIDICPFGAIKPKE